MTVTSYAIGLGSNRPHGRYGRPRVVIDAALAELDRAGVRVVARSPTIESDPVGLVGRRFANAAAIVESGLSPPTLLALLKRLERGFGRMPGRRWATRVLDLDILLWSGGCFTTRKLVIPHPALASRAFVLQPLRRIAPDWRVPGSGVAVRHLAKRLAARD